MGTWSADPFGNDAALDWLDDLLEKQSASAVARVVKRPFDEYRAFQSSLDQGQNVTALAPDEAEKLIQESRSHVEADDDGFEAELDELMREVLGGPIEDTGEGEADACIAAAVVLAECASGKLLHRKLRKYQSGPLGAYRPSAAVLRHAIDTLALVASNPRRLAEHGNAWVERVNAVRSDLEPALAGAGKR